LISRLLKH